MSLCLLQIEQLEDGRSKMSGVAFGSAGKRGASQSSTQGELRSCTKFGSRDFRYSIGWEGYGKQICSFKNTCQDAEWPTYSWNAVDWTKIHVTGATCMFISMACAGAVSTDSCCDSLPAKRPKTEAAMPCNTCQTCLALQQH